MKMAHLIMAHKDPKQIERLVKKMCHQNFDFYIHVDKKVDIKDFECLLAFENVYLTKTRVLIRWGGYSFVEGILQCMSEILKIHKPYDFINLMSAQEYPIKPVEFIYNYFNNNIGKSFITLEDHNSEWWIEAEPRINTYHLTNFDFKGRYFIQKFINKILPKRKFPLPVTLYGGPCSSWWTFSMEMCKYVVEFIDINPQFKRFAYFTWAPDEFLIPSIIMNSPLRNTIIEDNFRYIDWTSGGANPKILTTRDFENIKTSNKFIARKFDIKVDTEVLDMIDTIT